jgi:rhodanese-related sulfurtransferase
MASPRFPDVIAALSRKLLELCGIAKGMQAIELASRTEGLAALANESGATIRVEALVGDALPLPNQAFDAVCCQLGLPRPMSATRTLDQVHRVLKPGGRFGVIMPGARPSNAPFTAAAAALRRSGVDVDESEFFAFSTPERLDALLSFAGFVDISIMPMNGVAYVHEPDDYWRLVSSATGWPLPLVDAPPVPVELGVSKDGAFVFPFEMLLAYGSRAQKPASAPETWARLVARATEQIEELSPEEVRDRLAKRACTLIDIREPNEASESLPQAIAIPRGLLEDEVLRRFPDVMHPIVLYSGKGERSAVSAKDLESAGYRQVYSMEGGFKRWKDLGLPTTTRK